MINLMTDSKDPIYYKCPSRLYQGSCGLAADGIFPTIGEENKEEAQFRLKKPLIFPIVGEPKGKCL